MDTKQIPPAKVSPASAPAPPASSLRLYILLGLLAIVVGAYLIGSVSFAVVVSKAFGLPDPHEYGSGNPGATNVLRTGNKQAALLTLLGDGLTTVTVKWGITVTSARNLAPQKARQRIEAGAKEALGRLDAVGPYDPGRPCEIKVEFKSTDGVEEYKNRRGVDVLNPRLIVSRADAWWEAWNQFFF